jgi:phytoene dehydrogenase-like protein
MTSSCRYDALVIGAGMSGLAAGIRLAQFDKKVAVLERHALWGGLNSFYKHAGRRHDTGLHALTNFAPRTAKSAPLNKALRQLRIPWEGLKLAEQTFSEVVSPAARISFSNDFALLESEVARAFPSERDGFARLVQDVRACDPFDPRALNGSGRAFLSSYLRAPELLEMLLVPLCYYGSAREDDIDAYQLVILFRSMFLEGLARPVGGIKTLLDLLVRRYKELGGELRMNAHVASIVLDRRGAARGVRMEDGSELESDCILSSAGALESRELAGQPQERAHAGRLSFMELIHVTDQPFAARGHSAVMTFYNTRERFHYRRPEELVDPESGVICCTDNYTVNEWLPRGLARVTCLASFDRWSRLAEEPYRAAKLAAEARMLDVAARFFPDPRPHTLERDAFTPCTIRHYTQHIAGAVYGAPEKHRDGSSGIENLHLIGTDQGLLGIVGAMLSGITMANRHALIAQD